MVTARDGAPDYRLATATVTVKVIDVEDEVPIFRQSSYEARVKENVPDYMVIQVMVSVDSNFLNKRKRRNSFDLTNEKYMKPVSMRIDRFPGFKANAINFRPMIRTQRSKSHIRSNKETPNSLP